jgi:hypothetical protein
MRKHIDIVGWINIAWGVFGLFTALFVTGVISVAGLAAPEVGAGERTLIATIALFVGGFIALLSVPSLLAGWGLLRRKHWARIVAIILAVLHLFNFPLGTLTGGYSLGVLFDDDARRAFDEGGDS